MFDPNNSKTDCISALDLIFQNKIKHLLRKSLKTLFRKLKRHLSCSHVYHYFFLLLLIHDVVLIQLHQSCLDLIFCSKFIYIHGSFVNSSKFILKLINLVKILRGLKYYVYLELFSFIGCIMFFLELATLFTISIHGIDIYTSLK